MHWYISNISKYLYKGNIFFLEAEKIAQWIEALITVLMTGLAWWKERFYFQKLFSDHQMVVVGPEHACENTYKYK